MDQILLPVPFDKREGFMYCDGKIVAWGDAKLHVLTHALHYGSACFEGIRIYGGKVFKNAEHSDRLCASANMMDFAILESSEEISQICADICKKNNILDGYIRPIAWRGSEQMQVSAKYTKIHFAVAAWEWPQYPENIKKHGLKLLVGLYKRQSPECGPVHAKASGLYVTSTLIKHDAEKRGFDDSLALDYRDYIAESSTSNFFVVFENEIHTPIPDCFLDGITRKTIISLAKDLGYKVVERHISLHELKDANDAFLTGTASEVARVSSVTERNLKVVYEFKESAVFIRLLSKYQELVRS